MGNTEAMLEQRRLEARVHRKHVYDGAGVSTVTAFYEVFLERLRRPSFVHFISTNFIPRCLIHRYLRSFKPHKSLSMLSMGFMDGLCCFSTGDTGACTVQTGF